MSNELPALAAGASIGPYVVAAPIGAGRDSATYLAHESATGRAVALKVPRPKAARRILDAARIAAGLPHPRLVRIEAVLEGPVPAVVLERCPGGSLADSIAAHGGEPFPLARVHRIAADVLDGLICAHTAGLVHRALRPSNVLLDEAGRAQVADLLLAAPDLHAPPEVTDETLRENGRIDGRADVFSLGEILRDLLATARTPPPEAWMRFLAGCLQPRPADRFPSALATLAALSELPMGRPGEAAAPPRPHPTRAARAMPAPTFQQALALASRTGAIGQWARPPKPTSRARTLLIGLAGTIAGSGLALSLAAPGPAPRGNNMNERSFIKFERGPERVTTEPLTAKPPATPNIMNERSFILSGPAPDPAPDPRPAWVGRAAGTFVLVIGIDRYPDPRIPALRYAEKDARAVHGFFASSERATLLTGAAATRRAVLKAVRDLAAKATRDDDTAILYFAGHGFADAKTSYLAGSDAEIAALPETAISASQLEEAWGNVRASRKVLLVDACHAAGVPGVRGIGGIVTVPTGPSSLEITASGPGELSTEDPRLGHGVFTYALLEALRGSADHDRDGRVSGDELAEFLAREVPSLAAAADGRQAPVIRRSARGADFPISGLASAAK